MAGNSATLQIAIEVTDNGTVKLRNLGKAAQEAGQTGSAGLGKMNDALEDTDKVAGKTISSVDTLKASIVSMGAAYLTIGAADNLLKIADTYTQIESRLKLVVGETENLRATQDALYESANRVRTSYESQADLFIRSSRSLEGYNVSQEQALAFSEALTQSVVISGAKFQEASSFVLQFSQALQKGTLNDDEFKSVMESNGRAVKVLTDYLTAMNGGVEVSVGELRKMSTEGKLTADVLYNAFSSSQDKLRDEFSRMGETVEQATLHVKNSFEQAIGSTNDTNGAVTTLVGTIEELATTVESNKEGIILLFTGVVKAASEAVTVVSNLANSVKGFAAVAAGELSITQFATMGSQDLKKWMADYDTGIVNIQKQLEIAKKRQDDLFEADAPDAIQKNQRDVIASLEQGLSSLTQKQQEAVSQANAASMGTITKSAAVLAAEREKDHQKVMEYAATETQNIEMKYQAALKFAKTEEEISAVKAKRQQEYDKLGQKTDKTGDSEQHKAAAEALKAERDELTQITASMSNYVNASKQGTAETLEWAKSAGQAADGLTRLNDQYETAGLSAYDKLMTELAHEFRDGQESIAIFQAALEQSSSKVAQAQKEYESAAQAVVYYKKQLADNTAGSSEEDLRKIAEVNKELEQKAKALGAAKDEQQHLNAINESGAMTEERLKNSIYNTTESLEKQRKATIDTARAGDDFFKGWSAGILEMQDKTATMGEFGYRTFTTMIDAVEGGLTDFVDSFLSGEFDSIGDLFDNLCKTILKAFTQLIAEMIAQWVMSGIVKMIGGEGFSGFSMPSFGGAGGGAGGFSDYASMGTAALGAGSAAYGWLSSNDTPAQYNIANAYIDDNGKIDYSGQDASNYGSAALTAGKAGYEAIAGGAAAAGPTGLQMAGAGIGAVGGAYGLYNAFGQMAEGKANAGTAVQAAASIYSLYKAYPVLMSAYETYVGGAVALQSVPTTGLMASNSMLNLGAQSGGAAAGASGWGGAAAGAGTAGALLSFPLIAGSIWEAFNQKSTKSYQSPTYGGQLSFRDDRGGTDYQQVQRGVWDNVGTLSVASAKGGSAEEFNGVMDAVRKNALELFDILDKGFGDQTAKLATQIDNSDASVDRFLDSLTGYDVAMSDSALLNSLAQQAAMGNNAALGQLTMGMEGLGLSAYDANAATLALVTRVGTMPEAMYAATGSIDGMTSAVQQFSATPFNIRVNTQPYMLSDYDFSSHASGGIFTRPTLLPSMGGLHQVAEAGYPEAIVPLRSTNQISEIQDGLTALRAEVRALAAGQQAQQPIQVRLVADDASLARAFTVVADSHVVARNRSGLDPHQRAVY